VSGPSSKCANIAAKNENSINKKNLCFPTNDLTLYPHGDTNLKDFFGLKTHHSYLTISVYCEYMANLTVYSLMCF